MQILSLLRGDKPMTDQWVKALNALTIPSGSEAIVVIPSGAEVPTGINHDLKVRIVQVDRMPAQKPSEDPAAGEKAKTDYILSLINESAKLLTASKVLFFDDDITPPADALTKLTAWVAGNVKCATALYAYRHQPQNGVLKLGHFDRPALIKDMPNHPFDVWTGGYGFSVWDLAALKQILPIKRYPAVIEWDFTVGDEFEQNSWRTVVHGDVICKHG